MNKDDIQTQCEQCQDRLQAEEEEDDHAFYSQMAVMMMMMMMMMVSFLFSLFLFFASHFVYWSARSFLLDWER